MTCNTAYKRLVLPRGHIKPTKNDPPGGSRRSSSTAQMAPNLAPSTLEFIHDMILSNELTPSQIARAASCNPSTLTRHTANMNLFGSVKAPPNKGGRPRVLTPIMAKTLCEYLLGKPHLYLDEMAIFLWDEFQVEASISSISRALKRERWSKKTAKYKARERNADLRDAYFHYISDFRSYSHSRNRLDRYSLRISFSVPPPIP